MGAVGVGPFCLSKGGLAVGMFCWRNVVKAAAKLGLLDMSARRALGSLGLGVVVVSPGGWCPGGRVSTVAVELVGCVLLMAGGLKVVGVLLMLGGGVVSLVPVGGVG